jgi:hypothetical protein
MADRTENPAIITRIVAWRHHGDNRLAGCLVSGITPPSVLRGHLFQDRGIDLFDGQAADVTRVTSTSARSAVDDFGVRPRIDSSRRT